MFWTSTKKTNASHEEDPMHFLEELKGAMHGFYQSVLLLSKHSCLKTKVQISIGLVRQRENLFAISGHIFLTVV